MSELAELGGETPGQPPEFNARHARRLARFLGIRIVEESRDRVLAEIEVRDELLTPNGTLAGGVIMAFADIIGARATILNLPPHTYTTTLESKTNFFAGCGTGVVRAEARPLHRGRRTMVWQTQINDAAGRLLAQITQTQMVLPRSERPASRRPPG
jgi:1,4-dihydroxy-2-naphthoyl-CoA hydrolase